MAVHEKRVPRVTLSPYQASVLLYKNNGLNFDLFYLDCKTRPNTYIFQGPDFLMIGCRAVKPDHKPYWFIDYVYVRDISDAYKLFKYMPYYLDTVGFHRYLKTPNRKISFYNTQWLLDQLNKLSNGKQT